MPFPKSSQNKLIRLLLAPCFIALILEGPWGSSKGTAL